MPAIKRISVIAIAVLALLISCSHPLDAGGTALRFFDVLYNQHDLEAAEKLVTENSKSKLENDFKFIDGALQIVTDAEPVHYDYEVVDEKSQIKNDSAFIVVKTISDSSEIKVLLLHQNNDWKIDLTWDEQMMNAANKEVTDQVLRIMKDKVRK